MAREYVRPGERRVGHSAPAAREPHQRLGLRHLVAALGVVATVACEGPPRKTETLRPDLSGDQQPAHFEASRVRHDGVRLLPGSPMTWNLTAPASGRLRFAWAIGATGATGATGAIGATATTTASISIDTGEGAAPVTITRAFAPGSELFYEDLPVATEAPAGIRFLCDSPAGAVLSDLRIVQPSPQNDALIVVLLDTTRRDAVGLYGSHRPTTPRIDRIFARAWKAERAWSPASWTTPAVASLLTGLLPANQEDASGATVGIAPDVATLAEDFAAAGWSTAHFNGNPALNVRNGFHRGFTTFFTPPYELASMALPGSTVLAHVPPWIRAHEGERFLLYLQLIEPHEPYGRPDRPPGTTPFDPDYTGRFRGIESHYDLSFDPTIEPRDVEHLRALYDDDVRYGDQLIGDFWDGLDAALRERATLVFLSDHGEEFLEHGGWKHGPSLYDEVLRIPFLVRPGNGRPVPATPPDTLVSLTDFLPTVEHLLEVPRSREVDGVDLLQEETWTRDALPAIRMLTGGAARAVVVRRERKLFFFDRFGTRGLPDEQADPKGHRVALHLREFMPGLGEFDLASDPDERLLLPLQASDLPADWRAVETSLAHVRRGLEARIVGGSVPMRVQFRLFAGEGRTESFALEPQDLAEPEGSAVRLDFDLPAGDIDGVLFADSATTSIRIELTSGCLSWNGERLSPGASREIGPIALGVPRFTVDATCASLAIWRGRGGGSTRSQREVDEEREKLRALGYIH